MDTNNFITLQEWAELKGLSYTTAYARYKRGSIDSAYQDPESKKIYVSRDSLRLQHVLAVDVGLPKAVTYILLPKGTWRNGETAQDLKALLEVCAYNNDLEIVRSYVENGYPDDMSRPVLLEVLRRRDWSVLIVPDSETLSSTCYDAIEAIITSSGRKLISLREDYQ